VFLVGRLFRRRKRKRLEQKPGPLPSYRLALPTFSPKSLMIRYKKIDQAIKENLSVAEIISETSPGYLSLAGARHPG
jgi:hypothetical protein